MLIPLLIPMVLAQARPVVPTYTGNCQGPVWSPDGARLAYEVNYHDKKSIELYIYEPGGVAPVRVQPVQRGSSSLTAGFSTSDSGSVAHELSWSPADLGRFVYSASTARKDYDLFIDGTGAIAPAAGTDGGAAWSPDGRYIAFTTARTGQGDLYLLDVNALEGAPSRLTDDAKTSELYASWSADSRSLAYVGHSKQGDNIFIVPDVAFPSPKRITSWPHAQTRPAWSPTGTRIAFYSNHDRVDRFDLYVVDVKSGGSEKPRRIAKSVVMSHRGPAWTPDGQHVVYVADDDTNYDPVWMVSADGSTSPAHVDTQTVGNGDLDVVRGTDGKTWLAIAAQGRTGDDVRDFKRIYVMALSD